MGKKSLLSGVQAKGSDRIQFDFEFEGTRYRPTLTRIPSESNLRRAHKQLLDIKKRIERGTFNFQEEFPGYRYKASLAVTDEEDAKVETCNDVFDKFLAYSEHRVSMDDMALSTLNGYRRFWIGFFGLRSGPTPSTALSIRGSQSSFQPTPRRQKRRPTTTSPARSVRRSNSAIGTVPVSSIPLWR